MLFQDVAVTFNQIEPVQSRLEMTRMLSELLKKATPQEAKIISYLSLGELNPPYIGTQTNFAEKSAIKSISKLLDIPQDKVKQKFKETGDLGSVITVGKFPEKSNLTVEEVYARLFDIVNILGEGSQELKQDSVLILLRELDSISAKFIIRIITHTLRLGFSDMTLIDAISWMLVGDKSLRKEIENEYNLCVDIGLVIFNAKAEGIEGVKKLKMEVGIPVRPAAAERLPTPADIIEKIGDCIAQPKIDGFRLQVHLDKTGEKPVVRFFSRNLVDMSHMFPDLVEALLTLNVDTLICEGEAVVYDVDTGNFVPFQETIKRKRKHGIQEALTELPLKLFLFDILYLNGESLLHLGCEARRDKLKIALNPKRPQDKQDTINLIEEKKVKTAKELEDYFLEKVQDGLEGVVVKKTDSIYQAGKRNFNWIKLKRELSGQLNDSVDCVILGYYNGSGKRSGFGIGAFLVGVFNKNKDHFQTIAKIGTGMTDAEWKELKAKCDKIVVHDQPKNIECHKNLIPDVWVNPEIVCEVKADEITMSPVHTAGKTHDHLGYALRFPRFISYRIDKDATDSTSPHELKEMYDMQFKKSEK
jgi:DNA ligase-1